MKTVRHTVLSALLFLPMWLAGPVLAQDAWASEEAREEAVAWVAANREATIQSIVDTWRGVIEQRGGHASQLESTLQHARNETLVKAREAQSLDELNALLAGR